MSKKSKIEGHPDPYAVDRLAKIPPGVKTGILKAWLYGACFFFIVFTPIASSLDWLDLMAVLYGVLVLAVEYLGNTLILWMNTPDKPTKKYLPHEIDRKSFLSLFATAGYVLVVFVLVNLTLYLLFDVWGLPPLGLALSESTADPFTFAFLFLFYDYLWISLRGLVKRALGKRKKVQP